jgi:hypothetical protein
MGKARKRNCPWPFRSRRLGRDRIALYFENPEWTEYAAARAAGTRRIYQLDPVAGVTRKPSLTWPGAGCAKHDRLVQALTGKFDDHHAELARMLLDQIDALSVQIGKLTTRIEQLIAAIPAAQGIDADGTTGPAAGHGEGAPVLPAVDRLDEVTGIGREGAQAIIAEIGLHMPVFPTPGHLVSWAKISPQAIQSGARSRAGRTGKGNPYLKGILGEAAAAAAKTGTFLGERYRRIVKRRGKLRALVAVARSILVIIWHLLADPAARFTDLGAGFYDSKINSNRKARSHVRQLEALGYTVTLTAA